VRFANRYSRTKTSSDAVAAAAAATDVAEEIAHQSAYVRVCVCAVSCAISPASLLVDGVRRHGCIDGRTSSQPPRRCTLTAATLLWDLQRSILLILLLLRAFVIADKHSLCCIPVETAVKATLLFPLLVSLFFSFLILLLLSLS